ncbi:MAG: LemA family protein [Candidatus Levybacteria bacterium GW2011_GWB1_35_5]|nr:MAG: LemA family protein [Candidatus Levybacteria bacterium GW2011_GWB1_35_5]
MNLVILVVIVVAVLAFIWFLYNSIIVAKLRVNEALSQIDVQLKRRTDLIPNLVEAVKGYAKHEKQLFEDVTKERANLVSAKSVEEKAKANNQLTETFKSIFAVAEAYPALRASENFMQLQEEVSDTENKIAYSRQFYNSNVLDYNTKLVIFPNVLIAGMLGFKPAEFFAATEEEKKAVKVSF